MIPTYLNNDEAKNLQWLARKPGINYQINQLDCNKVEMNLVSKCIPWSNCKTGTHDEMGPWILIDVGS